MGKKNIGSARLVVLRSNPHSGSDLTHKLPRTLTYTYPNPNTDHFRFTREQVPRE